MYTNQYFPSGWQDQQQSEVVEATDRWIRGGTVEVERSEEETHQGGGGRSGAGGDPAEGKHPTQEQSQVSTLAGMGKLCDDCY